MSEMRSWALERILDEREEQNNIVENNFNNDVWTTKILDSIPLSDLGTPHLINCIDYIERNGASSCFGLGSKWLPKLNAELATRDKGRR